MKFGVINVKLPAASSGASSEVFRAREKRYLFFNRNCLTPGLSGRRQIKIDASIKTEQPQKDRLSK